jgi:4-amino-4-deoxy-L-arabinose transferase-like glycosyltransferase
MPLAAPARPRPTLLGILVLWVIFYASFTLFAPPLLDDADSVHAEVAREMLLRHNYVTLYANGIRYLEKAPLLYWSMALSFKLFGVSTAAARVPLAFTVLALALIIEVFARRVYRNARAGLYAALILLSSFGPFLFTRILIPDAMVCLWLTLALYAFWRTEEISAELSRDANDGVPHPSQRPGSPASGLYSLGWQSDGWDVRGPCYLFASACALNVLTKGLIGVVFPVAIVLVYLLLTRGPRAAFARIRRLHPWTSLAVFLAIAAPWHILIALANPAQGHPGSLGLSNGHLPVHLPTQGNVHGWLWFYFVNEQLLRYLNLRVPRDYDTVPLWLFWSLCLIWLMPWSAFAFRAIAGAIPLRSGRWRQQLRGHDLDLQQRGVLLCTICAAFILLFFSLSTRQEYYVLPALPALAILLAGQLLQEDRANLRINAILLALGTIFAAVALYFLLHARVPSPQTGLAGLLQQHPGDYALSMGHFLDLNAQALGLFRLPLALAAASLFLGPLISFILRKRAQPHASTLALAAGAFGFLLAAHIGLQTFAPVLTSVQLAQAIAPQITRQPGQPPALIVIHQEYEFASTLGFYLHRPGPAGSPEAEPIHILEGRSSDLWYGSFFPDAPAIFETHQSLAKKWPGPQRIFLWQDLANQPGPLPPLPGPIYVIAQSGGKEIVSNQPNSATP